MRTIRSIVQRALMLVVLAGASLSGGGAVAQQALEFRVVVHPDNPVDWISADELSKMFLKRSTRWSDGVAVRAVDQPVSVPAREALSQAVHGRSAKAIAAHWQQQIFSGRAVPPPVFEHDEAVASFVASHRGAVGYVSPGADTRSVKVVEVRR